MNKLFLLFMLLLTSSFCLAQNYPALADSCNKIQDYECAGKNYDLFLANVEAKSNMIALWSATAWAKVKNKEKVLNALIKFVENNYINENFDIEQQLQDEKSFDFLKDSKEWKDLITRVQEKAAAIAIQEAERLKEAQKEANEVEKAKKNQKAFENALNIQADVTFLEEKQDYYTSIKNFNSYKSPQPFLNNNALVLYIRVSNAEVPFFVQLPSNYDPTTAYPTLIALHGAVKVNIDYPPVTQIASSVIRMTSKHIPTYSPNYITIYPMGTATINWMNTEVGFDMVNRIVKYLKSYLNIDDNKIHLIGHSNGAAGVFTYLVKFPSLYAGFYGMNTYPKVHIGGTFLKNGMTRHFYNFTTDKDYYYPPYAVKTIDSLGNSLGVEWHTEMNKGYPHWFPSMNEALKSMEKIFLDMQKRVRSPFPQEIYFETDDVHYGNSDWITITALDTFKNKAQWHKTENFIISEWMDNNDFNKTYKKEEFAFDYPRKSGVIKAIKKGNEFFIETSQVKAFQLKLNREMVDYQKNIVVFLNGKKVFSSKVKPDKNYTLWNFRSQLDRKAVWENELYFKNNE